MRRREFIAGLGIAAAWPEAARAQQPALPVVGFVRVNSDSSSNSLAAFRKGLGETGYAEGQNVTVEYHSLEGQFDRLPALMADLVRRRVAAIATPASTAGAIAAKAATTPRARAPRRSSNPCQASGRHFAYREAGRHLPKQAGCAARRCAGLWAISR